MDGNLEAALADLDVAEQMARSVSINNPGKIGRVELEPGNVISLRVFDINELVFGRFFNYLAAR